MKIIVIKSDSEKWYNSAIGMEFEVAEKTSHYYKVKNGKHISFIRIDDCDIIKESK